jgi:hypothetical protein
MATARWDEISRSRWCDGGMEPKWVSWFKNVPQVLVWLIKLHFPNVKWECCFLSSTSFTNLFLVSVGFIPKFYLKVRSWEWLACWNLPNFLPENVSGWPGKLEASDLGIIFLYGGFLSKSFLTLIDGNMVFTPFSWGSAVLPLWVECKDFDLVL